MTKGPLIEDPAKRSLAIAGVCGLMLIISLAIAGLISGASLGF